MGTLTAYNQLTMTELAKRSDPNGSAATIAEVLDEDNAILQDAVWMEANDVFSHKITRRAALPAGSWRKLNEGVPIEASRTINAIEGIGMLESYSENDVDLIKSFPNPTQARMDEATPFIEGMGQNLVSTMIYGNSGITSEKFTGLAPRLASLAATQNVIGQGGTGNDLTSIFCVQWGPMKVHMIYPRGHASVGISHRDLGEHTVTSIHSGDTTSLPNAEQYQAYRDHFQVKAGMAVRDNRCIGRLANIEYTGADNTFDEDNLIKLLSQMKGGGKGSIIYANKWILTQMHILAKDKTNIRYTFDGGDGLSGMPLVRFMGFPVRQVDQILITESALT